MGMTIECYSAEPQAILALFAARNASGDLDSFFEKLETYPVVDVSFHLHIPEDLDSLCQALRKHHGLVPPTFRELFVEHVWYDGLAESLTLLNKTFTLALAGMSASAIEQVALDWAATFPSQGPLQQTPAYQSLRQLREVALDTVAQTKSLLFYVEGHPAFFRWEGSSP